MRTSLVPGITTCHFECMLRKRMERTRPGPPRRVTTVHNGQHALDPSSRSVRCSNFLSHTSQPSAFSSTTTRSALDRNHVARATERKKRNGGRERRRTEERTCQEIFRFERTSSWNNGDICARTWNTSSVGRRKPYEQSCSQERSFLC